MNPLSTVTRKFIITCTLVIICSFLLAGFSYQMISPGRTGVAAMATPTVAIASPSPVSITPQATSNSSSSIIDLPSVTDPGQVRGIDGNPAIQYEDIPWVRLGYPTCGGGNLTGKVLQATIQHYHQQGIRVMLTICQQSTNATLFNPRPVYDAAQGRPDALQCGNEQMKDSPDNRYITPENFARYFDLCVTAVHSIRPDTPVILGALDPHVGGVDYQPLVDQVHYLDAMQQAMNTQVHPGGNWSWRSQIVGLIDSWHNGYPTKYVNSLAGLFTFWAQQFGVDLNSGALGKHLWVIEGTGCFKGCGIDVNSQYQVAVSHILTLITDVQTVIQYHVPFFYFSGKDFNASGFHWPIGVLDSNNHSKPLRQDLAMGARKLTLSCASGEVIVADQEQLLAKMYANCTLPSDYIATLTS